MIDVSAKKITKRQAIASAKVFLRKKTFILLTKKGSPKGDVLETAKVAGIMAAKCTSDIIPMCHPLPIEGIDISFVLDAQKMCVTIMAKIVCRGRTGVEMEALTAVSVAALTVYDMMKFSDKGIIISDIQLEQKSGGRSGLYSRRKK